MGANRDLSIFAAQSSIHFAAVSIPAALLLKPAIFVY
jgi:hypothetical protein